VATERRRQLVLAALAVILAVVIVQMWPGTSTAPAPTSNPAGTPGPGPGVSTAVGPPVVHLEALHGERPRPESAERDLFRFKQKAPPPPPVAVRPVAPPPPVVSTGPPPPLLAPIPLKFIGIVEAPSQGEKIAILSDGRNAPFYGKEGAIIEGRYRILKIGVESVELAYADGRGRQTIRLNGS